MSATVHLVLGPAGADRTGRLLAEYRTAAASGFGTALVVTRTRRHAEEVRARLGSGLAPLLFDVRAFADALTPAADTEPARDAGYLAESKEAGVDVRRLLKESGGAAADDQAGLGRAAEAWAAGHRRPFHRVRAVFLVGFLSLSPQERALLDALRATAERVWVEVPEGEGEAFAGARAVREWAGDAETEHVTDSEPRLPLGFRASGVREPPAGQARGGRGRPLPSLRLFEADCGGDEARLVVRQVRELLATGVPADRVLVVPRHLDPDTADRLAGVAALGVRVRAADHAVGTDCDYLFLVGLGEGNWPDLSASPFDECGREELRRAGFVSSDAAFRLGAERLLFLSLATAPRHGLYLSYPSTDAGGRKVRPGAFLREFKVCFAPEVVPRGEPAVAQSV